jgi:hypothetical protein
MRVLGFVLGLLVGAYVGYMSSPQICVTFLGFVVRDGCSRPSFEQALSAQSPMDKAVLMYIVFGALSGGSVGVTVLGGLESLFGGKPSQAATPTKDKWARSKPQAGELIRPLKLELSETEVAALRAVQGLSQEESREPLDIGFAEAEIKTSSALQELPQETATRSLNIELSEIEIEALNAVRKAP